MRDERRKTEDHDDDYDHDVLSPLIRGGSKVGFYLTEHKDTETQSFLTMTMTLKMQR